MKNIFIFFQFITLITYNSKAQTNNPFNQIPSEDDWSFPVKVSKTANAGLFWVNTVPDALNLLLRWKDLNPAENVYNWKPIDDAVATGKPFFIRIWASDTLHCPRWLRTKHPKIPILRNDGGISEPTYFDLFEVSPSNFYAIWDRDFEAEFKKFLLAFKVKNYLANPNVKFMYCPGAWRYNEWNLGGIVKEIPKAPISVPNFITWFKRHLDDYADASNGYPYKMMFTGYGRIENPADYGAANLDFFLAANDTIVGENKLTSYAVSIGMSVREGAQEYFNDSSDDYSWGSPAQTINNINYQTINENHPLHKDTLRMIGTENEGFCDPTLINVCSYYHLKMSTLKALQLRVNWLNARDEYVAEVPALYEYFRLTARKTIKNSPDAWAVLRQSYNPFSTSTPPALPVPKPNSPLWTSRVTLPYRNWEKWLKQREVLPDGKVVPVYKLASTRPFDYYNLFAEEALRTDKANGSNYLYFAVDDNFMKGGTNPVQIKVTYLDDFTGNWWVEYDATGSEINKKSAQITNVNDNKWKTITVNIADAGFNNRQNGNMDFRIYNGGNSNISVRFVRLLKGNDAISAIENAETVENKVKIYANPTDRKSTRLNSSHVD